jgi:hypothetical protein
MISIGTFSILKQLDLSELDAPFLEEEVLHTIKDMPSDNAPSSNGVLLKPSTNCVANSLT